MLYSIEHAPQVLKAYAVAREAAAELLGRELPQSGDLVVAILRQRESLYKQLDNTFEIEISAAVGLCGVAGERRLQEACLKCLPSAQKATSFTQALAEVGRLRQEDLFKMCSRSAQASVGAVVELIGNMIHGVALEDTILNASPFMQNVRASLVWFCTHVGETAKGDKVLRGREAFDAMFEQVDKTDGGEPLTFGQLQSLHAYTFMATDTQKELLAKAVKDALAQLASGEKASGSGGGGASSSKKTATKKDVAKKKKDTRDSDEATSAMKFFE